MHFFLLFFRSETLLFVLWAGELCKLIWRPPELETITLYVLALYLASTLKSLRRHTLVLCIPLCGISVASAIVFGEIQSLIYGFQKAAIFTAFFGSILMLRSLADRRKEIKKTQNLFSKLGREQTTSAFLIGSHLIGSVLIVGVMAILAPVLKHDSNDLLRQKAAEVCQRGMCLASLWSPFWVATAFISQQIPNVDAWKVIFIGFPMALVGLLLAHLLFAKNIKLIELWRGVRSFSPIVPSVIACAIIIVGFSTLSGFTTLEALIAMVPILTIYGISGTNIKQLIPVVRETYNRARTVNDEIVIVTSAVVLGQTLEIILNNTGATDLVSRIGLKDWQIIFLIIGIVTVASLCGIHQLLSIVIVLVVLLPLEDRPADFVIMEAALIGWAFASMVGVTAVSIATASAMFGVSRWKLVFGENLKFVLVFGIVSGILLSIINGLS